MKRRQKDLRHNGGASRAATNILCAAVVAPLKTMDTAARRLASWRLAESAIARI
jgi:hypothetical protein